MPCSLGLDSKDSRDTQKYSQVTGKDDPIAQVNQSSRSEVVDNKEDIILGEGSQLALCS